MKFDYTNESINDLKGKGLKDMGIYVNPSDDFINILKEIRNKYKIVRAVKIDKEGKIVNIFVK